MTKKVNIKKFTNTETITKFKLEYLVNFLNQFNGFTEKYNIDTNTGDELFDSVAKALHKAVNSEEGREQAADIINALQDITEMSNNHSYLKLLSEARRQGIALPKGTNDANVSAEDCAMYFWLYEQDFFMDMYAKNRIKNYQSFLYFVGTENKEQDFPKIDDDIIKKCQKDLNKWLVDNGRVRNPKIYYFEHGDRLSIIIKYGMPLVRGTSVDDKGKEKGLFFNPPQNDLLIYHRKYDEISLNTPNIKEQDEAYLTIIGENIFGDKSYFSNKKEFSVELLERLTIEKNFVSSNVRSAKLIELTYDHGFETEIRQSSNLMSGLVRRNKKYGEDRKDYIVSAKFNLTLDIKGKPKRVVTIENGNKAKMDRSEDGLIIEDWIRDQGFLKLIDKDKHVTFWDKLMHLHADSSNRAYLLRSFTEEEIDTYFCASETETDRYPCDNIKSGCSREARPDKNGDLILVCSQTPQDCCIIKEFDHRDLLIHEINFEAIAQKVHAEWSGDLITQDFKVISDETNLYRIGFYNPKGDICFPVYFHVPLYDGAYQEALEKLLGEDDGYIFLMPSIDYVSSETLEDKKRNRKSIIAGLNRCHANKEFERFKALHDKTPKSSPKPFPTPAGAKWEKFIFEFEEEQLLNDNREEKAHKRQIITVKCGQEEVRYEPADFKMLNMKNKEPTLQWTLLVKFIENNGIIAWGDKAAADNVKKQKQELIKKLKKAFFQTEDPIPYTEGEGYKCRFTCRVVKK